MIKRNFIYLIIFIMSTTAFAKPIAPRFSAVIFDCDGVLVDTEYLKFLSYKEALEQYKITFTLDEYMPLIGHS